MKLLRTAIDWLAYAVLRIIDGLVQIAGPDNALHHARSLGRLWWAFDRRHRNIALTNLRNSFPDWPDERLHAVGLASFQSLVCFIVDVLLTPRRITPTRWRQHVRLVNFVEGLELTLSPDQPIIMVTAHYGNFEIIGYTLATLGFPTVSVARPIDNPFINEHILGVRERHGQEILYKKGATGSMQDVLAQNRILCFIADQNAGAKGEFVNFFGRPASTYKSIALLAIKFNAPIIVGYARRNGPGFTYDIAVQQIIRPSDWHGQANEMHWITQRFSDGIEAFIREQPGEYWWIHRRWKSRPPWEKPGDGPKEAGARYPKR